MVGNFSPLDKFLSSLERCWKICRREISHLLFVLKAVPHTSPTDPMCTELEADSGQYYAAFAFARNG